MRINMGSRGGWFVASVATISMKLAKSTRQITYSDDALVAARRAVDQLATMYLLDNRQFNEGAVLRFLLRTGSAGCGPNPERRRFTTRAELDALVAAIKVRAPGHEARDVIGVGFGDYGKDDRIYDVDLPFHTAHALWSRYRRELRYQDQEFFERTTVVRDKPFHVEVSDREIFRWLQNTLERMQRPSGAEFFPMDDIVMTIFEALKVLTAQSGLDVV